MSTSVLGTAFLVIGLAAMFLMFHLWGYPFDKATKTSSAPRGWMLVHRVLGYLFVALYVVLMAKMVPRLWQYQVEFPARTAIHIVLGFAIGFLLLVKIAIMRFFRHFEEWMPVLGTSIALGTVLLTGLSLPFVFQERALASGAPGGDVMSAASRQRVAKLLPDAGMPGDAPFAQLATVAALTAGREVLLEQCVKCHDLKTILAKPRTPTDWWDTVERMADKPALFAPMSQRDLYDVTAYLVAITPDLQKSRKKQREIQLSRADARAEEPVDEPPAAGSGSNRVVVEPEKPAVVVAKPKQPIDMARARATYATVCSQCHDLSDIDAKPPKTSADVRALIRRMIDENEATLTSDQVAQCSAYLTAHFVAKTQ